MEIEQKKEKEGQTGRLNCSNNIETVKTVEGKHLKRNVEAEIIAVMDGSVGYFHQTGEITVGQGQLIFFPPGTEASLSARESSKLIIFQPTKQMQHIQLPVYTGGEEDVWKPLDMKGQIYNYMQCLWAYLDEGFGGEHFCTIKTEELFLLFKRYYKDAELARFFGPLPTTHASFAYFIYTNYNKVRTVKELAEKSNLSLSGFEKEFRKVFHTAPYRWIKQKRTESIYYEICHGVKPLKVISEEYGFSSTSQMNDYCKKEFGLPPGKIRELHVKKTTQNGNYEYNHGN
jgi:AraC-like DNA-binding protein